ncbi:hypothetical protein BKA62DRAFT_692388 [Auriculariales sp. MPI-PUGE-AT-0066]|nr:hypothetical protein BKA62DRAFT_692388 [Auriculariales sp. MPI-PUGE-AT-0066]
MSDGPVVTLSVNDGDRTDGIANASTLLASGMAFKVPITDQRLEQGEKMIGIITSNVTNAQALYSANSEVISTAFTAVGNLMANDVMKKATTDVLNVAKKVIGALDALSGVHPFIGLAVVAFKGIVQFELKRRENDKRVSALMLQATDMFSELLSLNHLSDPDQVLPSGQTIRGRLQAILDKILALVKDMGNCIDKYHKSKTISRFFKSMDIKNALIIRSALRIEDAITGVERLDLKLDVIMEMIRTKPAAEQQVAAEVARRGGADAVLNDTSKIKEVIEATETATPGDKKRTGVDKGVEASLLHELRTPLETQLAENRRLFEVTLEMKTNELKEAVQRTQTRILHALNKGAYTRIKDPHIRYVWRSMKWSLSVQTTEFLTFFQAYFIPAIHDYFSERVGTSKHHDTLQSAISAPVSPGGLSRTGGDDEEDPPTLSNEDEWCLEYLSVYHIPPLKEAFDDDVNGLINVSEVNNFARSRSMPHDWTILQRLAYASHRYELAIKIQALMNSMIYDSGEVLQQTAHFRILAKIWPCRCLVRHRFGHPI